MVKSNIYNSYKQYYVPTVEIKDYNFVTDGKKTPQSAN